MSRQAAQQPLFDLQGVWHTYAGSPPIDALRGVDLKIYPGEYVAIIGANGSGKSTLARHLNALLQPTRGRLWAAGIPTEDITRRAEIRLAVQMVFQQPDAQIVATTVEEDVAFGPENFGIAEAELPERVKTALQTVGMWEQRSRPPHQLSGGQKQRVAIAGALALRPRALVMDESTAMLDPMGRQAVLEVLRVFHTQGTTLVTITHEMQEAAEASRVVVLHQGRVVMDGDPHLVFGRAEELRSLGLDIPLLADLSLRLGLPVCLSGEELLAALGQPPAYEYVLPSSISPDDQQTAPAQSSEEPVITVQGLAHRYLRGTPLESQALRGVDLQIERKAIAGLIGPTGSGKSTLLQHLNGLIRPQEGHVWVDGNDWADESLDAWSVRQKVGLLFQQPEDQLFERFVGDDIAFGPRQMKLDPIEVRRRVQTAMEAVGLPFAAFKDRLTQTLSGGEQRRAALAGVLAVEPLVLAADEPTAGLDPRGRADVLGIMRRVNQAGTTVIFGSHRLEDILALCQQVVALQDGRVAASGPVREILGRSMNGSGNALPVVLLANQLRAAGWPVPTSALTVAEISAALTMLRPPVN